MNMTRKAVNAAIFAVILFAIIAIPVIVKSGPALAAGNSAEFVIGLNEYFVNDQLPGVQMDAAPYIQDGRTLVPVRYLADALGAATSWNGTAQEVTVTSGSTTVAMTIGSTALTVNGQGQTMDVAPVINGGRTYLPARWVAENLGYSVDWDATNKIVIIWPQGTPEPDYSNATAQVQTPAVVDGFNIPAGTHLDVDTTPNPTGNVIDFTILDANGDLQAQVADAQSILAQAQCLDPATVARAMAAINRDLPGSLPQHVSVFNSPNGGSVKVIPYGNLSITVQVYSVQYPSSMITTD